MEWIDINEQKPKIGKRVLVYPIDNIDVVISKIEEFSEFGEVLYIKDEEMLEEVRQLLIEKGFEVDLIELSDNRLNYLQYDDVFDCFITLGKYDNDTELTLEEFINLLNAE